MTFTCEQINTNSILSAVCLPTVINATLAMEPSKTTWTGTCVVSYQVYASGVV